MMQNNDSNKFSNENNKLLDMVKQYLGIEHQEKEKDGLSPKARRFASGQMTRSNLYYHFRIKVEISLLRYIIRRGSITTTRTTISEIH